jgi:large subunit ribosomal protein L54
MICSSCRQIFLSRIGTLRNQIPASISSSSIRYYASTVPVTPNAAPQQPSPSIGVSGTKPNPTQTQPLSDSHNLKPSTASPKPDLPTPEIRKPKKLKSSVAAGQELKGLGYTKAKPVIKAMEDHEYPDWLWTLLDESSKTGEASVDLAGKRSRTSQKIRAVGLELNMLIVHNSNDQETTSPLRQGAGATTEEHPRTDPLTRAE